MLTNHNVPQNFGERNKKFASWNLQGCLRYLRFGMPSSATRNLQVEICEWHQIR